MNKSAVIFIFLVAGLISNTMGQFEPFQDVLLSTKTFAVPVEEETTASPALPVEETEEEEVVTDLDELEDTKSLLLAKVTTRPQPIQPIQIISQLLEEQPLELEIVTLPLTTTTRVRTTTPPPTTTTEESTTEQVTTTEEVVTTTVETTTEKLITTELSSETTTLEETSPTTEESTTLASTSTQIPVVDMSDHMMLDHQSISVQTEDKTVVEDNSDSKTSELVIDSTVRDHMTAVSETEAPSSPEPATTESSSSTSDPTTLEPSTSVETSSSSPPPPSSSYSSSSVPISTIIPTVEITTSPVVTEKVILDELTTEAASEETSTPTPVITTQKVVETTTVELVEKTSTRVVSQEPETKSSTTLEPSTTIVYTSSQPLTKTESIILATVNIKVAVPLKNSSVHSNAASNKDFKIKADGIIQNDASSVNKICVLTGVAAAILSSLLI